MAKGKLFDEFKEGTLTKLDLYRKYLIEWIPVFTARKNLITNTVNIFDFFSGVGCDSKGTHGSPMIAIEILMSFSEHISRKELDLNIYLNDYNLKNFQALKDNINNMHYNRDWIKVHFYNCDFIDLFTQLKPKMKNAANLMFLDQFGVKYVGKNLFEEIIKMPMTDLIFFISSNTFHRFSEDKNVTDIVKLDTDTIKNTKASQIHNLVTNAYRKFIPNDLTYYLAPFSIQKKKGKNIYGLIFGSGHPLGIEKILKVCWEEDKLTGEANFDIEDTQSKMIQYSLFPKELTKIERFQESLTESILSGTLSSDKDVTAFMLNNGFISEHVKPILKKLKKEKKITYQGHLSYSSGLLYKKNKTPINIKLL